MLVWVRYRFFTIRIITDTKVRLHKPSTSSFIAPFKNGFDAVLFCCLHITSKRSKVPLTKTMTLTACVKEAKFRIHV